jgi:3-hydroxyacyl-CoA dehydrogenase/enoyl-CoA hydratase/3-hydroxybutyryl-CoA epimerase
MSDVTLEGGLAVVTLRAPDGVNRINPTQLKGWRAALEAALALEGAQGVALISAHEAFCVGADLDLLTALPPRPTPEALAEARATLRAAVGELSGLLRWLETQGRPVVALLNGSALGGGYELALACHRRVALGAPHVRVGLPEVLLGLMPGGGGTQRLPRLIGLQPALELMTQGKTLSAERALKAGLVDEVVPEGETPAATREALLAAARAFVEATPRASQPWDRRGFLYPAGVQPQSAEARQLFLGASGLLAQKTAGAHLGPQRVIEAVQSSAHLSLDGALKAEAAAFVSLAASPESAARVRALWRHKRALEAGSPELRVCETERVSRLGVLGAGMMGAELALLGVRAGKGVVLRDISAEALARGVSVFEGLLAQDQRLSDGERAGLRALLTPTLDLEPLRGVELVIEAVVEDLDIKRRVLAEVEPLLAEGGIFASNTSALPISDISRDAARPERCVGMHFFSPASVMPLVELIRAPQTSQETLSRAWRLSRALGKTPVVVRDGYGFFTTRVFAAYILEGAQCVAEGYAPALVDWVARESGMAVGPLKVFDEVTLTLGAHAMEMRARYGLPVTHREGVALVRGLIAEGRVGRAGGGGFYDYTQRPAAPWSGLEALCARIGGASGGGGAGRWGVARGLSAPRQAQEVRERLALSQAFEAVRCWEEGVVSAAVEGDVAAVLGLGCYPNLGGPFASLDLWGAEAVVRCADEWVARGLRELSPPESLRRMTAAGALPSEVTSLALPPPPSRSCLTFPSPLT